MNSTQPLQHAEEQPRFGVEVLPMSASTQPRAGVLVDGSDDDVLRRLGAIRQHAYNYMGDIKVDPTHVYVPEVGAVPKDQEREALALYAELLVRGFPVDSVLPYETRSVDAAHLLRVLEMNLSRRAWLVSMVGGEQAPLVGPWRVVLGPTLGLVLEVIVPARVVVVAYNAEGNNSALMDEAPAIALRGLAHCAGLLDELGADPAAIVGVSREVIEKAYDGAQEADHVA